MADLNALHNDLQQAHALVVKLYDEHGWSQSNLTKAVELADEARDLLVQIAKDFAALDAALTKSRG